MERRVRVEILLLRLICVYKVLVLVLLRKRLNRKGKKRNDKYVLGVRRLLIWKRRKRKRRLCVGRRFCLVDWVVV